MLLLVSVCSITGGAVLVVDSDSGRALEVSDRGSCSLHSDPTKVDRLIQEAERGSLRIVETRKFKEVLAECEKTEEGKQGGFIFPGTRWCGPGNVASSYDDLGALAAEDSCCREHDHCPDTLRPGECRQGLCNSSPFTRSHCACDSRFRECLQEVGSEAAHTLGALFFNVARVICFAERPCQRDGPEDNSLCPMYQFYPSGEYHRQFY